MVVSFGVSIIIPVLNEVDNIQPLVRRITKSLGKSAYNYELIFVDDHSIDGTAETVARMQKKSDKISFYEKRGQRGKAFSIIEGVTYAKYDTVCMIDADLQYPPEAIVPMLDQLHTFSDDIVITRRVSHNTPLIRKITSGVFQAVFTKGLFGMDYDTQSGLKVFKKGVLDTIDIQPSPWSFDLQFIVLSLLRGYSLSSYDITFAERNSGQAKISVVSATIELANESVKLWLSIPARKLRKKYRLNQQSRWSLEG